MMTSYAQNGEDRIILDYFGAFRGVALSLGENDGMCLSNVRALIELRWSAVLVEPAATPFAKLKALYEHDIGVQCVQAAITDHDGEIDFWDCGVHLHKGDTSLLSTTVPATLERWKRSGEQFTKTTVRGITFETLMAETGVRHFEMISIDVEGQDFAVLSQMDLTALGCRCLVVETNSVEDGKYIAYAAKHGLKVKHKNVENLIFTL